MCELRVDPNSFELGKAWLPGRWARNIRAGVDGLGDGARAVGDGQGGGCGDSVGLGAVGDGGGSRAVGGHGSDDLGGVDDGVVGGGLSSGDEAGGGNDAGELHFENWGFDGKVD